MVKVDPTLGLQATLWRPLRDPVPTIQAARQCPRRGRSSDRCSVEPVPEKPAAIAQCSFHRLRAARTTSALLASVLRLADHRDRTEHEIQRAEASAVWYAGRKPGVSGCC